MARIRAAAGEDVPLEGGYTFLNGPAVNTWTITTPCNPEAQVRRYRDVVHRRTAAIENAPATVAALRVVALRLGLARLRE